MGLRNFTRKLMCCAMFAASVVSANAEDKLLILGDGVWGGWSLSNSVVMESSSDQPKVWKATVCLNANAGFKFLTETDFGCFQYRSGDSDVTLESGGEGKLYDSEENTNDNKFKVAEKANYDIVCDLENKTVKVTKAAYQTTELKHAMLWLIGSATSGGWNLGDMTKLPQDAANPTVYSGVYDLNEGELKIGVNKYGGWDQTFYLRDVNDDTKMVFGGDDNKWNITEAGKYYIKADVAAMTILITTDIPTGINATNADSNAVPTEYYTISGMKTNATAPGLYIMKKGDKVVKVKKDF